MDADPRAAFADASAFFTEVVAAVPPDAWDEPGIGDWTVRELAAHGNRANVLIVDYLDRPVTPAGAEYFTDEAIEARARQSLLELGDDPVRAIAENSRIAIVRVRTTPDDAEIGSPLGTMTLLEYLPSRTAELVLHGLDVARAAGLEEVHPSEAALAECVRHLGTRAVRTGKGVALALALSGRAPLPSGFSVY